MFQGAVQDSKIKSSVQPFKRVAYSTLEAELTYQYRGKMSLLEGLEQDSEINKLLIIINMAYRAFQACDLLTSTGVIDIC